MGFSVINTVLIQLWPFKLNLSEKLAGSKKSLKVDKI